MRTHQDIHRAGHKIPQYRLPFLSLYRAREQLHPDTHPVKKTAQRLVVLRRQNLRGRHHARLATVVRSYEHGHQCDKRLSAAHIALQQAVHLPSAAHVAPHLAHHPFLRPRKAERQILRIKSIEILAHPAEHYSAETVPPLAREAQDVKLYIEQFLKLQPVLRPPEHLRISREMHIAQRLH